MDKDNLIKQLQVCQTAEEFDQLLDSLHTSLLHEQQLDLWQQLSELAHYQKNMFSHISNNQAMQVARDRLLNYIQKDASFGTSDTIKLSQLDNMLKNFLLFKEALIDRTPDKRATIKPTILNPENEYDIQHLLYAMLKPAFPTLRTEVAEDSGTATVRADLYIHEQSAIVEVKCTRSSMSQRNLTEEIEADIVHYSAQHIFFLIYDKALIIKNPIPYQKELSRTFDGKEICLIIEQPKRL